MTPRLLAPEDIPRCLELCAEAGWNQTRRDWLRLLSVAPRGCFGIDVEGRLAATATLVTYGVDLAWIGMVLVRQAHRGTGLARTLLGRVMEAGEEQGVACLKLDATALGEPVYRKLGFVEECGVERWMRTPGEPVPLVRTAEYRFAAARDREAFGADRAALLWMLEQEQAFGGDDGSFALGRAGAQAAHFGPCVTSTAEAGAGLLAAFLARHLEQRVYWDRFTANAAREGALFGFAPVRHLKRMYRGRLVTGVPERQFALAGFEWG
jgi:GNAT superfamily N-acetyltransferase